MTRSRLTTTLDRLASIPARMREDVQAAMERDPAARSRRETLLYPGLHAVWSHRVAHALWRRRLYFTARLLSQIARFFTGVEIHPGARIGRRLFIDHGAAVVIGETAEIGDDVTMYHGTTLGGNSPRREKRHPTLEDGVTIGANATLIGPITVGAGTTVGAGAVVVESVPPDVTVAGVPARRIGHSEGSDGEDAPETDGPGPALRSRNA